MHPRSIGVALVVLVTGMPPPALRAQQAVVPPITRVLDTIIPQHLKLSYQVYLPPTYANGTTPWPLVLFLHGAGERGSDPAVLARTGLPQLATTKVLPFVLVAPQVAEGDVWSTPALTALLDRLPDELRIDPERVYLTGLSMGGFGAWDLATTYPERFAAVVLISGGGNPVPACRLKDVPVWLVHGRQDDVIPVQESELLARRLQACGGKVRLTVYPDAGHDAWSRTYSDPGFLPWLLAQRRASATR